MDLTKSELETLAMILKTEIEDTNQLIADLTSVEDKKELKEYLTKVKEIYAKVNKELK